MGFIGKNFCRLNNDVSRKKYILDKVIYASDYEFFLKHLKPAGWKLTQKDVNNINDTRLRSLGWYPKENFWDNISELCDNDEVSTLSSI